MGHQQDTGSTVIYEFVKPPETVYTWTELGTILVFRGLVGIDLDNYMQRILMKPQSAAQRATIELRTERLGGHYRNSRIFVLHGSGYPDGTSETQVQLLVQGKEGLYNIQRTKRTADLDDATVSSWVKFLQTARIEWR